MTTDNTIELSFYPNGQLSKATAHGTAADYLPAILTHLLGTAEPETETNEPTDVGAFVVSYLDDKGDVMYLERVEGERAAIVARAKQNMSESPNEPYTYAAVDIHRLGERVSHIKRRPKAADDDAFDSFVMALTRQAAISSATATNMNKVAQKQTDSVTHKFVIGEGWLAEFNKRGYGNAL